MSEFLNPKSMLTPGIAGGIMMLVVNGLCVPFPELPARYVALALSFVLGALAVSRASAMKVPERIGYWVVNSLVIFVVGFGANNLGREATGAAVTASAARFSLLPTAQAQEPKPVPAVKAEPKTDATHAAAGAPADEVKLKAAIAELRRENASLEAEKASKKPEASFFRRW